MGGAPDAPPCFISHRKHRYHRKYFPTAIKRIRRRIFPTAIKRIRRITPLRSLCGPWADYSSSRSLLPQMSHELSSRPRAALPFTDVEPTAIEVVVSTFLFTLITTVFVVGALYIFFIIRSSFLYLTIIFLPFTMYRPFVGFTTRRPLRS